ncbi:hypothetical protein [Streptacidiphilus sp. P02-A3a]|uniref:hypothetical protein n=1 Tax=Streptacidiphilus sp. P02-A3a TaxID=2704468 RepID=UPI0015FC7694|nr:hypothetical protein [Streptacidiphilus sp. P02-A3a]QMU67180.1 hypothetical protein GXP74_02100 [Streptacidiphilus sp. P02-A3a]
MRVHLSRHARGFTVLPNFLLQDRRLSYTARGLLADLLSRPDGWREDGRQMADTSPQGRTAVYKALRELAAAGYYRVVRVRRADGTFHNESHVYDTPQTGTGQQPGGRAQQSAAPGAVSPETGSAAVDAAGSNPVKDLEKEPSLPAPGQQAGQRHGGSPAAAVGLGGREAADPTPPTAPREPDAAAAAAEGPLRRAAQTLLRALGAEPRLRLGAVEAMDLAPRVLPWLERGCSERDLRDALVSGLPERVHSASALLRDRLERKLPPVPAQVPASGSASAPLGECRTCGDPVRQAGICRTCAGFGPRPVAVGTGEAASRRGAALVRAAMRPASRQPALSRA